MALRSFALALGLGFAGLFATLPVRADGLADEAEVNFRLGTERYQAGDFRGALAYFLASNRLVPNHRVRFNIARAFQRLGEYPEAHRWCQSALEGEQDPELRAKLMETLQAIEREVAIIEVHTEPAGATVYIDRTDLGSVAETPARIAVAPGTRRVLVSREGYLPQESEPIALNRGSSEKLRFDLQRIVGSVSVHTDAPTEVRVELPGETARCTAPCVLELPPGLHTLHFSRPGFRTPSTQVYVAAGKQGTARVEATPLTGSLLVTSQENGALVEVDGVAVGFTPVVARNIPVGARLVRVSLRGFQPVEQTVEVEQGKQVELRDVLLLPTREVTAAARIKQSIEEAPASVSVISGYELAAFRYPTIAEALRGQRGVALTYDGAYSGLALRGLGQPGDYGNRVLVLSDGATLNDNILWQSYVGYDGRVDLGDVDGIELVRGPGSVLYGTGAVSGVVNLIPRAMPRKPTSEFQLGTQDRRTTRARAAGALPLGSSGGLSLSASGARGGGEALEVPTQPEPTRVSRYNRFDAATGSGRLEYKAFTAQAFITTRDQQVPAGAYGAVLGARPNELRDTRGMFELRFEPQLAERLRLYARGYGNFYRFAARQTYPGAEADGPPLITLERYTGRWFGAEARIVAQLLPSLRLTAGGDVSVTTLAELRGSAREGGQRSVYLNDNEPYTIYAGYALAEWQTAPWLTVSAGGRVDSWSTFGATVNPRLAAIFRASERDVIKLMGGRAFRAPSIYELRYHDGGATQVVSSHGGNELGPELVWSGELEYTHNFDDGWSLLTSGHVQYALDLIEQAPLDAAGGDARVRYRNKGSSVYALGGDLELRRELRAGWMVAANYTYLRARYTDASVAKFDPRVPNVPSHGASVRGIVPLGAGFKLALRTTLEAPRRIEALSRAETKTAVITDLVLSGEALRSAVDYAVGLYNLFDWQVALPTDPTFVTKTMPQAGRTLLVSLTLRM